MMRSMFSGVSGLRIHQTKMDVIANNISNVNTVGFKSSRVTFAEIFSQTISGASGANPNTGRGGVNAMQIGLGGTVASIDLQMNIGAAQRTDNPFDLMIQGEGFFIIGDKNGTYYTRAGVFNLDAANNLVAPNGMLVYGWDRRWNEELATYEINKGAGIMGISITGDKENAVPTTTTLIEWDGNLNAVTDPEHRASMSVYDSVGNRYVVYVDFTYIYDPSNVDNSGWSYSIGNVGYLNGRDDQPIPLEITNGTGNLTFNKNGKLIFPDNKVIIAIDAIDPAIIPQIKEAILPSTPANGSGVITPPLPTANLGPPVVISPDINDPLQLPTEGFYQALYGTSPPGTPATDGALWAAGEAKADYEAARKAYELAPDPTTYQAMAEAEAVMNAVNSYLRTIQRLYNNAIERAKAVSYGSGLPEPRAYFGDNFMKEIKIDFSQLTQYGSMTADGKSTAADGKAPGRLIGVSIGNDGKITGRYSNGEMELLGQIAVANFDNPAGLEKVGDNLYVPTVNSGDVIVNEVQTFGSKMMGGVLEMSNVDLASEFTEMITTQRGFQANSRIITVSDDMLQELVNLKR